MNNIQILNSATLLTEDATADQHISKEQKTMLIHAQTDIQAIERYLQTKCKKQTTFDSVMGVLRKLQFFMNYQKIQKLKDFKVEDCEAFQQWLTLPPKEHVLQKNESTASKNAKTGKIEKHLLENGQLNPKWRPFACQLKPQTVAWNLKPINAMWSWLVSVNYLTVNPWVAIDTTNYDSEIKKQVRDLPAKLIRLTNQYLDEVTFENPKQQKTLVQRRWLFKLFF